MSSKLTVEQVDAFMRQLKMLLVGLVLLFVVPLLLYVYFLDRKLSAFETSLKHSPPTELQVDESDSSDLLHHAATAVEGQVVYVPAYSHIYHGEGTPYLLTITLSVRNTSVDQEIVVKSVRYFNTQGKEVESYLEKPVRLPALGTTEVIVDRNNATGGSGANFLVEWYARQPVTEPIIEAVMIDTNSQQGISFARRGTVISQVAPKVESTAAPADAEPVGE